jgi:predicted site-specific integrase-resolvase
LKTGTILVENREHQKASQHVVLYCRVSSHDQKNNLDSQTARLTHFATARGLLVSRVITEIGSGLNGKRSKLIQLLKDPSVSCIVVEHRDRLSRFGFEYLEALMQSSGRSILVMNPDELKDDLVQDMIDVMTSFCARLYGRRLAKNKAKKALSLLGATDAVHG